MLKYFPLSFVSLCAILYCMTILMQISRYGLLSCYVLLLCPPKWIKSACWIWLFKSDFEATSQPSYRSHVRPESLCSARRQHDFRGRKDVYSIFGVSDRLLTNLLFRHELVSKNFQGEVSGEDQDAIAIWMQQSHKACESYTHKFPIWTRLLSSFKLLPSLPTRHRWDS